MTRSSGDDGDADWRTPNHDWTELSRPGRAWGRLRLPGWVRVGLVVLLLLCGVPVAGYFLIAYQQTVALRRPFDALHLPKQFTVIDEHLSGSPISCIDSCASLFRRYSSPDSAQQTDLIFETALSDAGYRRVPDANPPEEDYLLYSDWTKDSAPDVSLLVFSKVNAPPAAAVSKRYDHRLIYADLEASPSYHSGPT